MSPVSHPLLLRQLRRHFGGPESFPEELKPFVEAVDKAYHDADSDRLMLERSLELSSQEFVIKSAELRRQIEERKKTEERLKEEKEKAEEASRLKDKFVSLVSHDIRTPFSSIMGLLRLLGSDTVHPLHEDQKALLEHVLRIGEGLVNMVDRLLDVSKLRTGKIKPKMRFVEAASVTAQVTGGLSHAASEKGIDLVDETPPGERLYTDPALFTEVIQNLVTNAIKFSNKGDRVTLYMPEGGAIAVRDTGLGIRKENIPRLFRHDEKTNSTGTAGELGAGLGLPFSMDIMKALGGTLKVESIPGDGSVFTATLSPVRPLILLVEDDELPRLILKESLESLDADVIEAEHGEEALAVLAETTPNLVVTDINMPNMNGFNLLKKIKESRDTRDIPVMVITSDDKIETREKAFRLGAADFCGKPPVIHDFLPRARRLLA
ncbi:MAG: ATP-binding response regulator [Candidatus Nitrospinota bacterium M3_3B_026]